MGFEGLPLLPFAPLRALSIYAFAASYPSVLPLAYTTRPSTRFLACHSSGDWVGWLAGGGWAGGQMGKGEWGRMERGRVRKNGRGMGGGGWKDGVRRRAKAKGG
jgi:hypothetical protein